MPFWMVLSIWWVEKAEPWLKRNWHWMVAATGGLVLFIFAITKKRPKVEIVSTELSGADQVKRDLEEQKRAEEAVLKDERDSDLKKAEEQRNDTISGLLEDQEDRAESPPEGDSLTDFLKDVGKDVRR
jgi:hypothetical protein